MSSLRGFIEGFKDISSSSSKTGKTVFSFLKELIIFSIIAGVTGFLISFPIYYLGTEFTDVYKRVVFLGLALTFLGYFIYRAVQGYKEEWRSMENVNALNNSQKNFLSIMYSIPLLLPKWIRLICHVLIWAFVLFILLYILGLFIFFVLHFLTDSKDTSESLIKEGIGFFKKMGEVIFTMILHNPKRAVSFSNLSGNILWIIFLFVELVLFMTLFEVKPIIESKLKRVANQQDGLLSLKPLSLTFSWFFVAEVQIVLLYGILIFLSFYQLLSPIFS